MNYDTMKRIKEYRLRAIKLDIELQMCSANFDSHTDLQREEWREVMARRTYLSHLIFECLLLTEF